MVWGGGRTAAEGAVWDLKGTAGCVVAESLHFSNPSSTLTNPFKKKVTARWSCLLWTKLGHCPANSPRSEKYPFVLRRERERDRERCFVCKREVDRQAYNKSSLLSLSLSPPLSLSLSLSSCTSFVNLFWSSSCHSPLRIFPPRIVVTSSLPLSTSHYLLLAGSSNGLQKQTPICRPPPPNHNI